MNHQTITELSQAYRTFFGKGDALYQLFSPYRICPLGAHVDHQHGLVTGFAFNSGIDFLFSATETGKVEMCSLSFEGLMTFNVQRPVDEKQNKPLVSMIVPVYRIDRYLGICIESLICHLFSQPQQFDGQVLESVIWIVFGIKYPGF